MTDDTGGAQAERSGRRQRRARLVDITLAGLFLLLLASSLANLYLRREANRIKKDQPPPLSAPRKHRRLSGAPGPPGHHEGRRQARP
jgi:hypothetical protein